MSTNSKAITPGFRSADGLFMSIESESDGTNAQITIKAKMSAANRAKVLALADQFMEDCHNSVESAAKAKRASVVKESNGGTRHAS